MERIVGKETVISTIFLLFPFLSSPTEKSPLLILSRLQKDGKNHSNPLPFSVKDNGQNIEEALFAYTRSPSLFSTRDAVFQICPPSALTPLQPHNLHHPFFKNPFKSSLSSKPKNDHFLPARGVCTARNQAPAESCEQADRRLRWAGPLLPRILELSLSPR